MLASIYIAGAGTVYGLEETCHTWDKSNSIPSGYGAAYNLLSSERETLIQGYCFGDGVEVQVGSGKSTQYVYSGGYLWENNTWVPVEFSGDKKISGSPWYVGSASSFIALSEEALANTTYVVSYVCQWDGEGWKCGCADTACATPAWQLQAISIEENTIEVAQAQEMFSEFPALVASEVMIGSLSALAGAPGEAVVVKGFGFTEENNELLFEQNGELITTVGNIHRDSETALTFSVPSIPVGLYSVRVRNSKDEDMNGHGFVVTEQQAVAPTITSFSPESGSYGTTVVLQGKNFTSQNNIVTTSYGSIKGVPSSDGTTLTITIEPYADAASLQELREEGRFTFALDTWFSVLNTNGASNQVGPFSLE